MRAAIYCRISDDREGRGLGVARQETDCRALCEARGWEITGIYVDNDISASKGRHRPQYEQLCQDLKDGTVDAVVTYHNDRLHRDSRELEDFIALVEAARAEVATVAGGHYDLTTSTGRMSARIVGAVARAEAERIADRTRRKHLELAQQGKTSGGGTRPFGFDGDFVTVREDEAVLIREAAVRVLAGETIRGVLVDWNDRGVRSVTGRTFTPFVVRRMLMSARIAGRREHKGILTDAVWPAIVDEITWRRLRAVLSDPTRRVNGNPRRYLLTGLAVCGVCGVRLVARPRDDKRRCYVCASGPGFQGCGKIRRLSEPVEDLVLRQLRAALDEGQIASVAVDDEQLQVALDRVAELEGRLEELATDFYADRSISRAQFTAASDRLSGLLGDAQRRVAAESRRQRPPPGDLLSASFEVQRATVVDYVAAVLVDPAVKGRNRFDPSKIRVTWR